MKSLYLKVIRFKNFLSTGEMFTEVLLDRSPVTIVTGKNGDGKSTVSDAITFALFGKPVRKITKANLVNTKNGRGLLTEIEFNVNNKEYMVRRGTKPEIFEIFEQGEALKQDATARDFQSKLENIIGVDYNTFTQTIIISKTKYTPFMQLDSNNRRLFVEGILNLTIFGEMYKIQNKKLSAIKSDLDTAKQKYLLANNDVKQAETNVVRLNNVMQNSLVEKIQYVEDEITKKKSMIDENNQKIKSLKDTLYKDDNNSEATYNKNVSIQTQLKAKSVELNMKITNLRKSDVCNACGQKIDESHIAKHEKEFKDKLTKVDAAIVDLDSKIAELHPIVLLVRANAAINSNISDIELHNRTLQHDINNLEQSKSTFKVDDKQILDAKQELQEFRDRLYDAETNLSNTKTDYEYNQLVYGLLKDGGIKSTIVNKSIPVINHAINQNLSKFGFFVNFELDSEFNENIRLRGTDNLSYFNFSEGEKLRIDMAILLAWREVAQLQNNLSCNVLFFDEMTDASLDIEGSNVLGTMLHELQDTNVFIITHTPEKLENIARSHIRFKKVDGYSKIV